MKGNLLTLMAAGAIALCGFVMVQRKLNERAEPHPLIKETLWSKLRELWAIRRCCQQIKLQQQQNRRPRSNEFYGGTQQLAKLYCQRHASLDQLDRAPDFHRGT
jgi:hypothetical protein